MIFGDVLSTIGKTPMVEFVHLATGLPGRVVAKLEMRNPCGSVKDRLGIALIDDAEKRGALQSGATLIEPTGGNTGIGLALRQRSGAIDSSSPCRRRCPPRGSPFSGTSVRRSCSRPAS